METVSFIGCGKVGCTLARAMKDAGYEIGMVYCRKESSTRKALEFIGSGVAATDLVAAAISGTIHFITTNDDSISAVVAEIVETGPGSFQGHYFFHTSGSLPSTVLEPLASKGAEIGSIHPLQVFAEPQKALETLEGIYYAIEGTEKAMMLSVKIVDHLKGKLLLIPTARKALYHAAGVFAANYLTVLADMVIHILEEIGETPEDAYQAFLPLMVGALQNIEEFGVNEALTGPISRGDIKTVKTHLDALQELPPEIARVYRVLGQGAVDIALRSGRLGQDKARQLYALLEK